MNNDEQEEGTNDAESVEQLYCNTCGKKMKKKPVKTPLGSFDNWVCTFCHP